MAKMMKSDMMCGPGQCGPKCIVLGLLAAAFGAAGLWTIVGGIMKQWSGMTMSGIFLSYFGGFILFCIAKMCKIKCCGMCRSM